MKHQKEIFIIYPNQLFEDIKPLKNKEVLLIEEPLFFTQYKFHIQKLILHRASMKFYERYLKENGIEVKYFEDESYLKKYKDAKINIYELFDNYLEKKVYSNFKNLNTIKNPNFINTDDKNRLFHNFYINKRKELNIFMQEGKPLYGKYSFDQENRKKLPKGITLPKNKTYENEYIKEAKTYCKKFNTSGNAKNFFYPVTFEDAKENLKNFIKQKFENFGAYQDALSSDNKNIFLFHSNISSSLNTGLLSLEDVIFEITKAKVPFASKEGFLRQIIGWREYMLRVYIDEGIKLRNSNFFEFKNEIPLKLLKADTKITILDDVIKKVNSSAYAHHIERLMVLGNIFLLLEIHPNKVHEFFMANFIDAYDWVMLANVYGMSGFSDGGSITTKPYICSSNYLLKMSDYKKNQEWCSILDALYWRFIYKYHKKFENNARMKMQISILKKMPKEKLQMHLNIAQNFLDKLTTN